MPLPQYNSGLDEDEDSLDQGLDNITQDDPLAIAAGVGGIPNVPRNPDDPREKIKEYLRKQEKLSQMRMTPEYLQAERAPANTLRESNRDIAFMKLMNQAANQAGTIGGKAASSAGADQYSQALMQQNQGVMGDIEKQRASQQAEDARQMKIREYLAKGQESTENRALKQKALEASQQRAGSAEARANKMLDLQQQKINIAQQKAGKAAGTGEGLKALDRDYAKDYNEWTSTGRASLEKNLNLLNEAKNELSKAGGEGGYSGRFAGRLPNVLRPEKAIALQQKVQEAAQGALKATLGAQFTEREGNAIMSRAYDPTLSSGENLKKIEEAINTLQSNAMINENKARYFEKNQTLQGFADPRQNINVQNQPVASGAGAKSVNEMSIEELEAELAGE